MLKEVLVNAITGWAALCWGCGMLIVLTVTPLVRSWTIHRNLLDRVGQFHTTHTIAVPRLGGFSLIIAFMAVFWGITLANAKGNFEVPKEAGIICLSSLSIFILGVWDDVRPLSARIKLAVQILIAWFVYWGGIRIDRWMNPFTQTIYSFGSWDMPLTILWLVSITNLINLIDGIDGLACGLTFFLMILLAIASGVTGNIFILLLSLGMAGALLGFLFYNFPPAKIFMGDGGAYFLGMLIAELALLNSNKGEIAAALIVPFFALGLPIIDASFTVFRRVLVGLPIFRADRKHIHHHLAAMGFSRQRVVLLLYAFCIFFALLALGVFVWQGRLLPLLFGVFMIVMVLSARIFGFVQNWYKLGRLLTDSVHRRKHTKYAILLGQLLFMEAERCKSVDELWENFGFLLQKLGFCSAILSSQSEERCWKLQGASSSYEGENSVLQEVKGDSPIKITFNCKSNVWDSETLQLLSELATEAWVKALAQWQNLHRVTP